jgi:hypothetical protein
MTRMPSILHPGDLLARLAKAEARISQLEAQLKARWQDRTVQPPVNAGISVFWGITQEAIAKDATGEVEIQGGGDDVVDVINKLGAINSGKDCYIVKPKFQTAYHLINGEC